MNETKHKIYVAGPMTGLPFFNCKSFDLATYALRKLGHTVFSPADNDRAHYGNDFFERHPEGDPVRAKEIDGVDIREVLGQDLAWICANATAIYMLRGWERSSGARAEHATAIALGIKIFYEGATSV